jgi:hypothetical protein
MNFSKGKKKERLLLTKNHPITGHRGPRGGVEL